MVGTVLAAICIRTWPRIVKQWQFFVPVLLTGLAMVTWTLIYRIALKLTGLNSTLRSHIF